MMDDNNQQQFLANLRAALGHPAAVRRRQKQVCERPDDADRQALVKAISRRSPEQTQDLLDRLMAEGHLLNLQVISCPNCTAAGQAIAALLSDDISAGGSKRTIACWQHPLVTELDLVSHLGIRNISIYCVEQTMHPLRSAERETIRRRVAASFAGITSADYCLADTASLVLRGRPGQDLCVALLPAIHIAVIRRKQLLADMQELHALLQTNSPDCRDELPNRMTMISGPSKTGDIEATMVYGVHGPRNVYLLVIDT
ncbi:MAG: lactate utilization protein [Deltaproteobacteria bacterium]|nr:lactate utilization protein [Candidatus Anaeroferrophillus wilburensis]MBN2889827.1 lactate utilization protein [Deltaproteobacteria bacterium]